MLTVRDVYKRQVLLSALFANLNVEAFDLLVEGGERDVELLGSVGLVTVTALELFNDDAALDVFEDVEAVSYTHLDVYKRQH